MIARRRKILRHAAKDIGVVVTNRRGLAVHQSRRPNNLSAKILTDGLVAEAHAENRLPARKGLDDVQRDSRLTRGTRAWRQQHSLRVQRDGLGRRNLIVAKYALFHAQLAKILDEVEGEGIEVVDDEQHGIARRWC